MALYRADTHTRRNAFANVNTYTNGNTNQHSNGNGNSNGRATDCNRDAYACIGLGDLRNTCKPRSRLERRWRGERARQVC